MSGPQIAILPDGKRLHLHHGPIDLIVGVEGQGSHVAFRAAAARFETILDELVSELPEIRREVSSDTILHGAVARRMSQAAAPYAGDFITPMAAVAGAVADEILTVIAEVGGTRRAYVNNGGDIAFYLTPDTNYVASVAQAGRARIGIGAALPWRGMATSGWRGRSFSLGIADNVTVVADNAASADAAATMIANAVNLPDHPAIIRRPAYELAPDSDLGARPVTVSVGALATAETDMALQNGLRHANSLLRTGLIGAAVLFLNGRMRYCGPDNLLITEHEREPSYA